MLDLFKSLVGDVSSVNPDLLFLLSCLFYLFVVVQVFRFFELMIDFIFRRKK